MTHTSLQHTLARWLQDAAQRAFPLEPYFGERLFFERVVESFVPSQMPSRGHWSSSLALQISANTALPAAEWAEFLAEHAEPHPGVLRLEVSSSGYFNVLLTAEALCKYWQPIWGQALCRPEAFQPCLGDIPRDKQSYAITRLWLFLKDFAAQQPAIYQAITTPMMDASHWAALLEEHDWHLLSRLFAAYAAWESGNISQYVLKKDRLASALHNYYNALLVLAERPPLQKLRLTLLILCFGILSTAEQSLEKNG